MRVLRETGEENGLLGQSVLKTGWDRPAPAGKENRGDEGGAVSQRFGGFFTEKRGWRVDAAIRVPQQAQEIIEKLNQCGFEAYVVGGCVRDSLLGREPEDWDITTSAKPFQVKEIFGRTIDTGIKHGTVTILRGKIGYEVTTFRIDGVYEDGRHPKSVEFTSDLLEDLKRRDFTINAMAYSRKTGLIDAFGGTDDLRDGRICCVGRAQERFTEDALRILRALRFSAQLGFEIETETEAAVRLLAPNLAYVSKERIQTELTKLLLSPNPDHMRMVFDCGVGTYVSETFAKLDPDRIAVDPQLPSRKALRWAALLRHVGPETAGRILRELKMDNDTIARVRLLTEWWRRPLGNTEAEIRRVMSRMSPEAYDDLLLLKESVLRYGRGAQRSGTQDEAREIPEWDAIPETSADIARIKAQTAEIRGRGDCVSLKMLAVTGQDLIALGMRPGREIGTALEAMLAEVIKRPERNTREYLLRKFAGDGGVD